MAGAFACCAGLAGCSPQAAESPEKTAAEATEPTETAASEIYRPRLRRDLGDYGRSISTDHQEAQRYFDQGLVLGYGFNHEQAIAAFEEAARLDPECAICWWGVAFAYGPNINLPMSPEAGAAAWNALGKATERVAHASPAERDLIEALAQRYAEDPEADRAKLDGAFAVAMGKLAEKYPDDLDVATIYAESMMNLYPWNYWTDEAEPREHTLKILSVLEGVMERAPMHPGANHLYIHAVEEYFPEKGVPSADRLVTIAPDAGHLVHMSSHIYWRVGRYGEAWGSNVRAIDTDEDLFAWCRGGDFYRVGYYPHNVHFMWAAAAASGQSSAAIGAARKLFESVKGYADDWPFVQEWLAIPTLTLARFGRWDAVLAGESPPETWTYVRAMWHYTRGLAYLRTGSPEQAAAEQKRLDEIAAQPDMEEMLVAGGTATARSILEIASAHLSGEYAADRGDVDAAVATLKDAVDRENALVYMEPPPWYLPMRQALGAVLLQHDRAADAEQVFRKDLEYNPKNGWSLTGLALSLEAQSKNAEAALARRGLAYAWERADVTLPSSRF